MIHFACPTCRKSLEHPDNTAGQKINCPGCGQRLMIPPPSPAPAPSSAAVFSHPPSAASKAFEFASDSKGAAAAIRVSGFAWLRRMVPPSALILVLVILPLPWIEIRCAGGPGAGKTLATQSGLQTLYGGYSVDRQLQAMGEQRQREMATYMTPGQMQRAKAEAEKDKLKASPAPLMILFVPALILAIGLGSASCIPGKAGPYIHLVAAGVGLAALLLFCIQVIVDFPLESEFARRLTENNSHATGTDRDAQVLAAMMFEQKRTIWVYLVFFVQLGALLVAGVNSFVDFGKLWLRSAVSNRG